MTLFQQAILNDLRWVAIALVGVFSAARISRLVTIDSFPPSVWLRIKWRSITDDGSWSTLVDCGWCFTVWSWAFVLGWGLIWDWPTAWWIFNSLLAGAYLAAMVQAHDGGGE